MHAKDKQMLQREKENETKKVEVPKKKPEYLQQEGSAMFKKTANVAKLLDIKTNNNNKQIKM
jgi:phage terminase small subunit